jgi:quercetin dioxygenase-like cupin family protein
MHKGTIMNEPTHGTSAQSRAILTVIVTNGERGNTYTVVAVKLPPHDAGTPPHRHAHHAESCYLVDGLLALTCDGYTTTLTPGAAALIPPNVLHTYWNPSAAPTIVLLIYRPRVSEAEALALAAGTPAFYDSS